MSGNQSAIMAGYSVAQGLVDALVENAALLTANGWRLAAGEQGLFRFLYSVQRHVPFHGRETIYWVD